MKSPAARTGLMTLLVALVELAASPGLLSLPTAAAETFCNPLDLDYRSNAKGFRHSADPVIVLFKDRYYLFATDDVPGYRVSDDLLSWTNIVFAPALVPLMSDNNLGTYCAPAVATDGAHVYFIRMDRREKAEATTQGNQLDAGAKAKTLPPLTTLGTIGPAKADGTFRDVPLPIPAALIADKDRLIVRLVRQGGKVAGLVAEVRVLHD